MLQVTVLLVDDHPLIRAALRLLIRELPGYSVIGEAGTIDAALLLAIELRPNLVILEIALPDGDGFSAAPDFQRLGAAVIILSCYDDAGAVAEAARVGVSAFVSKSEELEEVTRALIAAAAGRTYFSRRIIERPCLSPRETDVLRLAGEGLGNKEIAQELNIQTGTVKGYRKTAYLKLGLHSSADATRYASDHRLLRQRK